MMEQTARDLRAAFDSLADSLFHSLRPGEDLSLTLSAERSHFLRFSQGRVRQNGFVDDGTVEARLVTAGRSLTFDFPLSGAPGRDRAVAAAELERVRTFAPAWREDPFLVPIEARPSSEVFHGGTLPDPEALPGLLAHACGSLDLVGYFSSGLVVRAAANSKGMRHWFGVENFVVDCSAVLPSGQAAKASYAGRIWSNEDFERQVETLRTQSEALRRPRRTLKPGHYRVFLAPAALAELVGLMDSAAGEGALRQGESPLVALRDGRRSLSDGFSLSEDFSLGLAPRFNDFGEIFPENMPVIHSGRLANTLISARSAREYGIESNGAGSGESLRSVHVAPGHLAPDSVLQALGTGLYLANLHYCNWSDVPGGRITGMTRHACFWVENGELVAPISDMRFDDSIYSFFGSNLEAVTASGEIVPETSTYEWRSLGGMSLPGMLVRDFALTL